MAEPVAPKPGQLPSGRPALFDSEGRVYMRDLAGKLHRVPEGQIATQLGRDNWQFANDEDFKLNAREDAPWTTFAETTARGIVDTGLALPRAAGVLATEATAEALGAITGDEDRAKRAKQQAFESGPTSVGGGDVTAFLKHPLDPVARHAYKQRAQGRAEESPLAAMAGEVTGGILGGGALNPTGSATTRLGVMAVQGAASGISGASEDAFIHDVPLTGEQVAAAGFLGAALGGTLGAGFEGMGSLRRWVGRAGENLTAMHLGYSPGTLKRIGRTPEGAAMALERTAEVAHDVKLSSRWLKEVVDPSTGAVSRVAAREGEEGAFRALAQKGEKDTKSVYAFGATELRENVEMALKSTQSELGEVYRAVDNAVGKKPALRREIAESASAAWNQIDSEIIKPLRTDIALDAKSRREALETLLADVRNAAGPEPSLQNLAKIRTQLDNSAYKAQHSVGAVPTLGGLVAEETMRAARILEDHITAAVEKVATAPPPPGATSFLPADLANRYVTLRRQTGTLHSMSKAAGSAEIAERLRPVGMSAQLVGVTGGIRGMGAGAQAFGVTEVVRQGLGGAMYVTGAAAYRASKYVEAFTHKSLLAAIAGKTARTARSVGALGLTRFVGKGHSPVTAYKKRSEEVVRAAADPAGFAERVGKAIEPFTARTPKLAGAVGMTTARGINFLASKLPANAIRINPLRPQDAKLTASDADIRKFALYWETVNNPLVALDALAKKRLTREHVEALREVYPLMYQDIRRQALEILSEKRHTMGYDQRAQFDLLLDLNGAGEPSFSAQFQQLLATAKEPVGKPKGHGGSKGKPLSEKQAERQASRYRSLSGDIEAKM
jgi:hypothetical protein